MQRYGLIGKKLGHSFSRGYFTQKFEAEGLADHQYLNFELPDIDAFPALVASQPGLRGLNVTIPYKTEVLPYLDRLDPVVEAIRACNCIRIEEGKCLGYNTDVIGFRRSLEPLLQPHHQRALVLGTGGAAQAVHYVLKEMGIGARAVSRSGNEETLGYHQLDADLLASHTLLINTTPLGMYPKLDEAPPLPYDAVGPRHLLYDLIYNPEQTLFLRKGAEQGAAIKNGYEMLLIQAEESWKIWKG